MKFKLVVKDGVKTIFEIGSRSELSTDNITVTDSIRIIETEQFLERLFGFRFHIEEIK